MTNPPRYAFIDKYKAPGYTSGKIPPTEAYSQYISDLTRLTTEYYIEVITDGKSIDTFDDFVKTFRAAGGDEIEQQVNEQYNKLMGK
jgi:putative aldouronate transport system substrate-binding protein